MLSASAEGRTCAELQRIGYDWLASANLQRFDEAVLSAIDAGSSGGNKDSLKKKYTEAAKGKSNVEARKIARELLGKDVFFDWEAPRTREGYYRLKGGCDCAINRAIAYAPYADAIWMESKLPDFAQAKEFADGVHAVWPEQK